MVFSKTFPRTTEKSSYPIWEEIYLNADEEKKVELNSKKEVIFLMRECIEDARKIISDNNMNDYQSDVVRIAISLFEKRASHTVYKKEEMAKEKFDEKFGPDGI